MVDKAHTTSSSNGYGVGVNKNPTEWDNVVRTNQNNHNGYNSTNSSISCRIVRDGNNTSFYNDDTLVVTKSFNYWDSRAPYIFSWGIWDTGTITVTNIKIKPL